VWTNEKRAANLAVYNPLILCVEQGKRLVTGRELQLKKNRDILLIRIKR